MTNILPRSEIERMKRSILPVQEESYALTMVTRKSEMKQLSQDRMKHWPNTLEALRIKKESFSRDREENLERERQEVDRLEAELRKKMRLESIQKANTMLYAQTDKMKMLKSQKLYADTLETRKFQIEEKRVKKIEESHVKDADYRALLIELRDAEEKEKEKEKSKKLMTKSIALSRSQQLEEARFHKEELKREQIEIGNTMRLRASQQIDEEIFMNADKQKKIVEKNWQMLDANEEIKRLREEARKNEELAKLAIDNEVAAIEDRKIGRKLIEERRLKTQLLKRQELIDKATEKLAYLRNKEDKKLIKEIAENNERENRELQEKQKNLENQENLRRLVILAREEQIKIKEARKQEASLREQEQIRLWKEMNEQEMKKERELLMLERESIKQLKLGQLSEAKSRREQKECEKKMKIEQEKSILKAQEEEDAKFARICKAEINDYASKGKPVYTLLRALEQKQPDLLLAKPTIGNHA